MIIADSDLTTAFVYGEKLFYAKSVVGANGKLVKTVVPVKIIQFDISDGKILSVLASDLNTGEQFEIPCSRFEQIYSQLNLKSVFS